MSGPVLPAPRDRDEVARALLDVLSGGGGPVLLDGGSGVGKSRMLRDAVAAGPERVRLVATAVDWEQDRPHAVLAQLLGVDVAALADDDPFAAARRLAERIGDEPAVVVVDDAHWSDPASFRALSTLVRHHRATPVVVLLAVTPGEGSPELVDRMRRAAATSVTLGPLTAGEVEQLCVDRGRPLPPRLVQRLRRHTLGVPRHVLALLDEIDDGWDVPDLRLPAPREVAVRVRERVAALGDPARALVEAVACFADPVGLDEVARTAGLEEVLEPLSEAAHQGLVVRFGGRSLPVVGPTDPMVRAAVLDLVGPHRAACLRRRAAAVVSDPPRRLALLAAATPGQDDDLAGRLTELADRRTGDGAWADAAHALLEASRLTGRREERELLLVRAVDALIGAGSVLEAEALVPAVENLLDTAIRNSVLGYLAILLGRTAQAERALDRAWELCDTAADPDTAAWICQRRVLHALCCGDGPALVEWADRATGLVGPEHPAAVEARAMRGLGTAASGRPAAGLAEYRDLAVEVQRGPQVQRIAMGHGWLHLVVGNVDEARADLESAIPTTTLGGSSRISLWAAGWLARAHFLAGDWDLALRAVADGRRWAESSGIGIVTPLLGWTAAQIHSLRGDAERAERVLRDTHAGAEGYEIMAVPRRLARAALAEARSDHAAVVRALRPLAGPGGTTVVQPGWWPWRDVHVNALVLEGHLDEAEAFLVEHEARAADQDDTAESARLAWARGRLHAARGDVDAARDAFESALRVLEGTALRWDRARAHFAYGSSLRRLGRRREADTVLSTARDLFLALGATTYVARCDRELRAGGVHRTRGDPHGLTAQETAVVRLVATGRSNKDVAAELQVSPKTVQYHLTRIYTKVGVRSRTELARLHFEEESST